jgi:hypothetical protein
MHLRLRNSSFDASFVVCLRKAQAEEAPALRTRHCPSALKLRTSALVMAKKENGSSRWDWSRYLPKSASDEGGLGLAEVLLFCAALLAAVNIQRKVKRLRYHPLASQTPD